MKFIADSNFLVKVLMADIAVSVSLTIILKSADKRSEGAANNPNRIFFINGYMFETNNTD